MCGLAAEAAQELVQAEAVFVFVSDPTEPRPRRLERRACVASPRGDPRALEVRALEVRALEVRATEAAAAVLAGSVPEAEPGLAPLRALAVAAGVRPLGALVALRPLGAPEFDPAAERRLRAVADHLAVALQSAQLAAAQQARVRELLVLNEIAAACSELGVDRLLPSVVASVVRAVGADLAALLLLDHPRGEFFLGAAAGPGGPLALRRVRGPVGGIAGQAVESRRERRGTVTELAPTALRFFAEARGLTEAAALPLLVQDRAVGAVVVARAARPLTDGELRLLGAACGQMGVAVENARLFAETTRRASNLELVQAVGEEIARSLEPDALLSESPARLCEMVEADSAAVFVRRSRGFVLAGHHEVPAAAREVIGCLGLEDPLIRAALESSAPLDLQSADLPEPTRNFLRELGIVRLAAAPLRVALSSATRGEGKDPVDCTGMLLLGRRAPRPFGPDEIHVLGTIAAQLAVALQKARLYMETRRRAEDLAIISEAGRVLTGDLALEEALDAVADRLARLTGMRDCIIFLLDAKKELLTAAGVSEKFRQFKALVQVPAESTSLASVALRDRLPAFSTDTRNDPRTYSLAKIVWDSRSAAALPLLVGGEALGVVALLDPRPGVVLSEDARERVTAIASQVATATERARLNRALERSYAELEHAQAQLVRRERLAALGELAALVAHEVRNPLGAISNSLGTLAKTVRLEGDARLLHDIMWEEVGRLERIIGDLLDFARPPEPSLRPGALDRVIAEAVKTAEAAERARGASLDGLVFSVQVDRDLPECPMDERLIRQALVNVVSNALQALGGSGRIELSARLVEEGARRLARVEVKDDGPGIPPEVKARLFEPFFTTKATGSGLGLAVVRRIVEGHRGELRLESSPGKGTTFTLDLPVDSGLPVQPG